MPRQHQRGSKSNSNANSSTGRSVRAAVKSVLLGSDGVTTIEECRRCGRTTETPDTECPTCGCTDVVTYRIE
nr:hypothetical protein [Natrialba magadii]